MTWKKYSWRLTLNINVNFLKQQLWTDENITWINTAIPFYTEWKTLKSIKSKTLKPGCRLVSIFWTINHFSDTRAVFTPTLDSPVMHCTLPCTVPVHYGRAGTLHCKPLFNIAQWESKWWNPVWVICKLQCALRARRQYNSVSFKTFSVVQGVWM